MLRRIVWWLVGLAVLGAVGFAVVLFGARLITRGPIEVPEFQASAERGAYIFAAAGCKGCHTAKNGAALAGGRPLETPFGTFYGPNITPDPQHGIGAWSDADFVRALRQGVSPDGFDYYPVFPYTSFTGMTDRDMLDLKAYLFSLPPVATPDLDHEIAPAVRFRPLLAAWKVLNLRQGPQPPDPDRSPSWNRGRYLVRALGHCGECHTPRGMDGAVRQALLFAGAKDGPDGDPVPNITPHPEDGIGKWSRSDIEFLLEIGMLPDGDFVGGAMGEVVDETTGKLTDEDRAAITDYLLSLPPIGNADG